MKQGRSQRDVMNYCPPKGPRNIDDPRGVGLHGDNCGKQGSQGPYSESKQSSGMVGLKGDAVRCCGTQGKH
jgi:hypothetical protein